MLTGVSALLQLACASVVGVEVVLYTQLSRRYTRFWERTVDHGHRLPNLTDRSHLEGSQGHTDALVYRWDSQCQELRFRRRLTPVRGEWCHSIGVVRFDSEGVARLVHHPFPLSVAPLFGGLGVYGSGILWWIEGEPMALLGVPVLLVFAAAFCWMQVSNAEGMLQRVAVPQLSQILKPR